jgi:2',3'-cyclic-nucleotide 2'-phosphodiesterase
MKNSICILVFGDIVGKSGRAIFQKHIDRLRKHYNAHGVIVNGENSAQGRGITPHIVSFFKQHHVNVITTGNHIWQQREIYPYLQQHTDVLRPANYPSECPGKGMTTFQCAGYAVGVLNIQGRVFMHDHLACPFKTSDSLLTYLRTQTSLIIVDFHAEATSEKAGIGYYLDGRVSAVVGTHTHVQTADERILPQGTAFITDLGMAGALDSMIGMKKKPIIQKFITQMPAKFEVETEGPMLLCGVCIEIDTATGKAISIERFRIVDENVEIDVQGIE